MTESAAIDGAGWMAWPCVAHSLRTAVACGAALAVSWHRFIVTFLGAVVGVSVATVFEPHALAFSAALLVLGMLRILTHSDLAGYWFGGVALAIVLLVPRTGPSWRAAIHRFVEVSIGSGVALALSMLWPEREPGTA